MGESTIFYRLTLAAALAWSAATRAAAQSPVTVVYEDKPDGTAYRFLRSKPDDPYLTGLRTTFRLDQLVAGKKTDLAKVQALSAWVHRQWSVGTDVPLKSDPVSILEEAAKGKRFRDVEYAFVLRAALTAVGVIARPLNMRTDDAATRGENATHAAVEAWLREERRWVLVDPQWDIIPTFNNEMLNAAQFQKVMAYHSPGVDVLSTTGTGKKSTEKYFRFVRPYLYYFDTPLDARFNPTRRQSGGLMLMPTKAKELRVVQRTDSLKQMHYTKSRWTFYVQPE